MAEAHNGGIGGPRIGRQPAKAFCEKSESMGFTEALICDSSSLEVDHGQSFLVGSS